MCSLKLSIFVCMSSSHCQNHCCLLFEVVIFSKCFYSLVSKCWTSLLPCPLSHLLHWLHLTMSCRCLSPCVPLNTNLSASIQVYRELSSLFPETFCAFLKKNKKQTRSNIDLKLLNTNSSSFNCNYKRNFKSGQGPV